MTSVDWDRVAPLLERLFEVPEERRADWLAAECRGDEDLRSQVWDAYESGMRGDDFLASPIRPARRRPEPDPGDDSQRRIGPYRLVRLLGSGGMGVVWLAERADGQFTKRVALKLVKRGMDTDAVLRRFRMERQVLADLEHPWIARLLDGGTTDDGLPYLVMEYVDGRPLLDHCADVRAGLDDRLRLFARVCEAVHFAHGLHVVHRDLKPSNILVDANGVPKLLDFGIAKVLGSDDATLELTRTGERFVSPRYASPEQIRGETVGPASDVYALGVILYELVSGCHPYGWSTTTWRELEEEVLERDPGPPSRAVLTAGEDLALPCDRRVLSRALRGDLDTIVLAALRKEPELRYATARALAEDLRLHLDGRPIRAHRDRATYRLRKFVRRNRGLVAGTSAFVLLILIALTVSIRLYVGSLRATRDALWQSYAGHVSAAASALDDMRVADAREHLEGTPEDLRGWEWALLHRRLDRSRVTLAAPGSSAVAVDPPRGRVAYATTSALVVLDERTLERVASLTVRTRPGGRTWRGCTGLDFSPDGRLLASTWGNGGLFVHAVEDGRVVFEGDPDVDHTGVAFDPRTSLLAVGTLNGSLSMVDVVSGEVRATCAAHGSAVRTIAFDPEGRMLASGSWDQRIRLWSADLEPLHDLEGHTMAITTVAFDPSGSTLVSASLDGTVRLWDVATGEPKDIERTGSFVLGAAFDPSGRSILCSPNGGIVSWDARTHARRGVWLGHLSNEIRFALDPELERLWSVDYDDVREWDLATRDVPRFSTCEYSNAIGFDPRRDSFACGGPDGVIRLWSASDHELIRELSSVNEVAGLAFDPSGERLYALDGAGGVSAWDPVSGRLLTAVPPAPRNGRAARFDLAVDPSGERLLCSLLESIEVRDAATGHVLLHLEGGDGVGPARFDARAERIAAGDDRGNVRIWDSSTGELLGELPSPPGNETVLSVAFHPSRQAPGRYWLAVAYLEGDLRLYDTRDASFRVMQAAGSPRIDSLAFHPDGQRLAAGARDGSLRLWEVPSCREVVTLGGHSERIAALRFSPDGTALLSCSWDGTLRLWETGPRTDLPRR